MHRNDLQTLFFDLIACYNRHGSHTKQPSERHETANNIADVELLLQNVILRVAMLARVTEVRKITFLLCFLFVVLTSVYCYRFVCRCHLAYENIFTIYQNFHFS
jgi:hypothetical protein